MKILNINRILSSTNLNVDLAEIKTATGRVIERFIIDPINNSVVAVPVYNGKVVLIKRKHFLGNGNHWELPGGWIKEGEIALSAVRRKVEEDTGFEVNNISRLGSAVSDLGMTHKEKFYFFIELGIRVSEHDEEEVDRVGLFTFEQVRKLINKGEIIDEKTLTGLLLATNKGLV